MMHTQCHKMALQQPNGLSEYSNPSIDNENYTILITSTTLHLIRFYVRVDKIIVVLNFTFLIMLQIFELASFTLLTHES